ncbi:hypothetical protein V7S43_008744 [Phytophthora oleae]|uniref:Uncharacterized protein n=1 Tax=Phytophthora oleae TaxID=2107226 RepID=A0ABD3FJC0_9STRA
MGAWGEIVADGGQSPKKRIYRLAAAAQGSDPDAEEADTERHEMCTALPCMQPTSLDEVVRYRDAKVATAATMGLTLDGSAKLCGILQVRVDRFRLEFGHDPPVCVAPMQVRLKPGVAPIRAQPRRYSPNDRAFLDSHTDEARVQLQEPPKPLGLSPPNCKEEGAGPRPAGGPAYDHRHERGQRAHGTDAP